MRIFLAAGLVAGFAVPASALTVEQAVQQFVAPMASAPAFPTGVAVGVYHKGSVSYFNFGTAAEGGAPVDEHTIFEIGSVTKTFTAALLGEAVNAGSIDLNAGIGSVLPPGLTLQPAAQKVTPLQLASYSSGLPDDPPDLPANIEDRAVDRGYTMADFYRFLSTWEPPASLPAPYLYSNTGVGLLGLILAKDIPGWEKQVADQITGPLGMKDTAVNPAPDEPARHATGHGHEGRVAPKWPLYAWAAAGALRSTATDMTTFVAANLGHSSGTASAPDELLAAMKLARTPYYQSHPDKPDVWQGLTWQVNKTNDGEIVFKDGGTAGFSTFIGYNPAKDLGVVILANWNHAPVVKTGIDVISHVTGD